MFSRSSSGRVERDMMMMTARDESWTGWKSTADDICSSYKVVKVVKYCGVVVLKPCRGRRDEYQGLAERERIYSIGSASQFHTEQMAFWRAGEAREVGRKRRKYEKDK